jgi:methyl-accepting chemotaxis protein
MPKEVFKQMWSTIGRGEIFRGVVKNRAKDGTPYYVDAVIAPILGENGKPMKYLGVRYDITEPSSSARTRAASWPPSTSPTPTSSSTSAAMCAGQRQLPAGAGLQLDEIRRQAPPHVLWTRQLPASPAYSQFWRDLGAGKPQNDVFKRITKNGQEVWIQAVYAPVKDEMGRVSSSSRSPPT